MKVYTFSEARQNFATVLENAQKEGAVRITRRDGRAFTIQPVQDSQSPLEVKGVKLKLNRNEQVMKYFEKVAVTHGGITLQSTYGQQSQGIAK